MRIGYLTYGLDRSPTGIGRYSVELLKALCQLPGCSEIILLTTEKSDAFELWSNFEHHALPGCRMLPSLLTLGNAALSAAIKRYRLDLVHDPNGIAPFLGPGFGAKRIVTIHDAFAYVYPERHNRLDNWRYRYLLPKSAQRSDLVLTDSHHSARDIARYLHLPQTKIKPIPCAVSPAFSRVGDGPIRQSVLNRYQISLPYLLYVGGINSRKNIKGLFEAFSQVREHFPDLKLVIAGKRQWQTAEIDATFERLDLIKAIQFTGYVAEVDLPALYSAAEAFVFPSLYEGFGLPPLEAMACGTPVVTSNVSSLPEVVGDAALLINPSNVGEIAGAIEKVLIDRELRSELTERGLARSNLFSWERTARETLSAYEETINTPSGGAASAKFSCTGPVPGQNTSSLSPVKLTGGGGTRSVTGLSRYSYNLALALEREGHLVMPGSTDLPPLPGALVALLKKAGFDLKAFFTTYPLALSSTAEDSIFHLTSQNLASAVAFTRPKRLVITVHDIITLACRQQHEITGYMRFYDKLFDRLSLRGLRRADFLVADSEHTRQDIIKYLKYPPERIQVVYLGVEHDKFKPLVVPDDFFKRYNLDRDHTYILYSGSEDPRKNLHRLLAAFKLLAGRFPEVYLLKVGAARFQGERNRLLAEIEELGLVGRVRFIEEVSDNDLVYFYNVARVFVFASLYEGFGLPPLEAMACGTPVVCSNSSALPEVVGEAALAVDPYDTRAIALAIEQVLVDPALVVTLRERGFARAQQFMWEKTARQTLQVYQKLIQAPGPF